MILITKYFWSGKPSGCQRIGMVCIWARVERRWWMGGDMVTINSKAFPEAAP